MKKIIIFMLLIPNIVLGQTVYTEYEPFILNTNEYLEESEFLKREEVKLYNTYIEEIEEKYLQLNAKNYEYNVDYNDFIYEEKNSLEYNEYAYDYQTKCANNNYGIGSIIIKNFTNPINISEIIFLSKGKTTAFGIKPVNHIGYKKLLYDGDKFGQPITLKQDSYIEVYFFENIYLDEFNIQIYSNDQDFNLNSLEIIFNEKYNYKSEFILPNQKENIINITFDNNYNEFLQNNNFTTNNNCISYYCLKIPLYKHSKTIIIPLNNYVPYNNTDLFFMDDYKIIYNYYKREKIELEDKIILKEKQFNLKDYIISSTIPVENINTIHNINYEKEGIYNVSLYYQDKLLLIKELKYINPSKEENINKSTTIQNTTKKIITNKKTTKKISTRNTTNVTTNNVKQLSNKFIGNIKNNKYQKSTHIMIISTILIVLIIFECILLYVKKKYY